MLIRQSLVQNNNDTLKLSSPSVFNILHLCPDLCTIFVCSNHNNNYIVSRVGANGYFDIAALSVGERRRLDLDTGQHVTIVKLESCYCDGLINHRNSSRTAIKMILEQNCSTAFGSMDLGMAAHMFLLHPWHNQASYPSYQVCTQSIS